MAVALADANADVVLTWATHRAEAEEAAEAAREAGSAAALVRADFSSPGSGRLLIEAVLADIGPIDVLVANAGVGSQRHWEDVDDELWETTFAVNVTAPWQMAKAALPGMVDRGFGRVLFVSSVAALTGGLVGPHYAASKAALHGLMHHLAPRVAASGITINTLAPALIEGTRILPVERQGGPVRTPPIGRLGHPDEVASMAVAMICNPYLTNKVITLDGGLHPG